MSAIEAFGLIALLYFALSGLAAHVWLAWTGVRATRQHIELGRERKEFMGVSR